MRRHVSVAASVFILVVLVGSGGSLAKAQEGSSAEGITRQTDTPSNAFELAEKALPLLGVLVGGLLVFVNDTLRNRRDQKRRRKDLVVDAYAELAAAIITQQHVCLEWAVTMYPDKPVPRDEGLEIFKQLVGSGTKVELAYARVGLIDPDRNRVKGVQDILRPSPWEAALAEHPNDHRAAQSRFVELSQNQGRGIA